MHVSYTWLVYGKYTLFYESPKKRGIFTRIREQCVPGLSLGGGGGGGAWGRGYLLWVQVCIKWQWEQK